MSKVNKIMEQLDEGIKEVVESGRVREYLDFLARFRQYSFANTILIFTQRPDATLVKGFQAWKKLGRYVRKGEKGIKILAPRMYKKTVVDEDGEEKEETRIGGFFPVTVFDLSQTEGDPLPEISKEITGMEETAENIYRMMKSIIPIPVVEKDTGSARGYYHLEKNYIAIKEGISIAQKAKTLIHEHAHYLLHREGAEFEEESRRIKEAQAESIAYVVSNYMGLDTSDHSFEYIAAWSGEDIEIVKKIGEEVRQVSDLIIQQIAAQDLECVG